MKFDSFHGKGAGWIMTATASGGLVLENTAIFSGKTWVEIDLRDMVIRKKWKLLGCSGSRTYELDDLMAVQIKESNTILEGYNITSFGVYLASGDRKIRVSLTDNLSEARLIQRAITEFLERSEAKDSSAINTDTSGARIP